MASYGAGPYRFDPGMGTPCSPRRSAPRLAPLAPPCHLLLRGLPAADEVERDVELEDLLAGDHPLPRGDGGTEAVEQRRLSE
jgi:hypothetical protein